MSYLGAAWRVLLGAALLDFAVGPLFLWDAFSASLSAELHTSTPLLSIAYSVGLASFTTGVLVGGRVADSLAPRRLALATGSGAVTGLVIAALTTSLPVLVIGFGVVLGGSTGLGYATAVRVAGTVTAKRGSALAVVVSAYAAGAVVLAPIVDVLLNVVGRTGMFLVLAVIIGVLVGCASMLLPASAPDRRAESKGIAAIRPYRLPIAASWVMFLLGSGPALIAFGHAGQFARAPELAAVAVLLLNGGNFAGRLVAGPLADRIGYGRALHATAGVLTGACITLVVAEHSAVALVSLLVLGIQYGAVSVLTPMAVAVAVPADRFGTAYGMVFSGWGAIGLAGPVGAAWLATGTSYSTVAVVLVGVAAFFWLAVVWVSGVVTRTTAET